VTAKQELASTSCDRSGSALPPTRVVIGAILSDDNKILNMLEALLALSGYAYLVFLLYLFWTGQLFRVPIRLIDYLFGQEIYPRQQVKFRRYTTGESLNGLGLEPAC
jgi:hypothetical protein